MLFLPAALYAQWEVKTFGEASNFTEGICLGRGIRGEPARLYAGSGWGGDGKGYEWTYANGSWTSQEIYSGLGICYSPVVASVRGTGQSLLYIGGYSDQRLYEVLYQGSDWETAVVGGSAIDKIGCVRVAEGRNDGVKRLYFSNVDAGAEGGLYELSWDEVNGEWQRLKIHSRDVGEFAIADGRNDGILRIYAGSREGGDGGLVEFTWNGSEYIKVVLMFEGILQGRIQATYVGDGRGDGKNRVYVNEWNGRLFELSYEDPSWVLIQVAGSATRFYLTSGILRADNKSRLYASLQSNGVYEYTWSGTTYEESVDAISAATGKIVIGDGRNDGKNRLYVGRGTRSPLGGAIAEVSYFNEPELCEGNFDDDGYVDGSDLAVFAADFGRTDCAIGDTCEGDFDNDNDIDGSDLAVLATDFGRRDCP
jgi:hypothetical protein